MIIFSFFYTSILNMVITFDVRFFVVQWCRFSTYYPFPSPFHVVTFPGIKVGIGLMCELALHLWCSRLATMRCELVLETLTLCCRNFCGFGLLTSSNRYVLRPSVRRLYALQSVIRGSIIHDMTTLLIFWFLHLFHL